MHIGIGNVDLDVVAPAAGKGFGGARAAGGLQHRQLVQSFAGDHLAGEAARRKIRRHRKAFNHQAFAMGGVPHHRARRKHQRHRQDTERGLERDAAQIADPA